LSIKRSIATMDTTQTARSVENTFCDNMVATATLPLGTQAHR
jgi:hypothetical protein